MGFLDKLKDIGFGNTGPRGNQQTGAQNYNSYLRQRTDVLKERGITQALALEAKDGKQISWKKYIELGEKYGVPPEEIAKRGKLINEGNRQELIKRVMPKVVGAIRKYRTEHPDKPLDQNIIHKLIVDHGGESVEMDVVPIAIQWLQLGQGKKSQTTLGKGGKLVETTTDSLGGKTTAKVIAENKEDGGADNPKTAIAAWLKAHPDPTVPGWDAAVTKFSQGLQSQSSKLDDAQVWILPNLDAVRSFDGGRTYEGKDGKKHPMPKEGAFHAKTTFTGSELGLLKSQKQTETDLKAGTSVKQSGNIKETAEAGTGLYSNIGAMFDAVAGGVGIDKLFGKEGFFKDSQDARQKLRLIKQLGKSAFMNSSKGAIWEQEKIDQLFPNPNTWFTNPRTESRKIEVVREALLTQKQFNNEAIVASGNPKEISKFRSSNADIDKLMALLGEGEPLGQQSGGKFKILKVE